MCYSALDVECDLAEGYSQPGSLQEMNESQCFCEFPSLYTFLLSQVYLCLERYHNVPVFLK